MGRVKLALLSVYDKTGIVPLARTLRQQGIEIISTGGTLQLLRKNKIAVRPVSDVTGFPEVLDGRVKTLHPHIHASLLCVRGNKRHMTQMKHLGIAPIDLVVVNLYPFTERIKKRGSTLADALEHIDIGGPTMLRAAAKNYQSVGVVCDPADYSRLITELKQRKGVLREAFRRELATKVFQLTAYYDNAIQQYLVGQEADMPARLTRMYAMALPLRYGENPHQKGALYKDIERDIGIRQLQGKEISYNNILDIVAAREIISEFSGPAVAVIKHTNPCGIAEQRSLVQAIDKAIACDPLSAFGSIIIVNRPLDAKAARLICERLTFFEVLIAPSVSPQALRVLRHRKRLIVIESETNRSAAASTRCHLRWVANGLLVQERDRPVNEYITVPQKQLRIVSKRRPSKSDLRELVFAWKCAKVVKSNAVVLTKDRATVGIGAGQMSRVDAMSIACQKAGSRSQDAYVASDGFFPKPDNIAVAAQAGVRALIQPGGSIRDQEIISAVNKHDLIMICTGRRHFRH